MAIHYTDTIYQGINHHGMQVGFVYDNIGMIYVKDIDASGIDIRVLPKQEQDYFYDLLRGDSLGSGTSFPGTKKYGDRFYRTDESIYYKWDGYDWCEYGKTYYLMLDYFPTKSGYLKTGARVYRTDEDKEYRYSGSTWVEITATSGDTKKRIQSKDNMTVVTSNDESSSFYYRINPTDILTSEHWFVVPLAKSLGTGDSSAGFQVYWGKTKYPQRFYMDLSGWGAEYEIIYVYITLQSQETVKPIPDIIEANMSYAGSGLWYYDVASFIGGLYYREFKVSYVFYPPEDPPYEGNYYESLTGVIGRLLCDEYDPYYHSESYLITKYVNDSTGLDTNSGSASAPWKTINKAANTITAGTLVRIAAGTYNATSDIVPANSGSALQLIHYQAIGDVLVTGKGFKVTDKSYTIISGITFDNALNAVNNGITTVKSSGSPDHISIVNCTFKNYSGGHDAILLAGYYNDVIGNIFSNFSDANSYGLILDAAEYTKIAYNKFDIDYAWLDLWNNITNISATESINEIGNYCKACSVACGEDCIGTSSYSFGNITDTKPIGILGVSHNKAGAINWLDLHFKYGVSALLSYAFSPLLRHLKTVNVPAAGATVPHSFVKVIDANSKERLVAYSNKTDGTDYGACEIGENGEIIDGMDNVKIQSVNGANYSINPISRILDRNANGDIIIEGRSIIHE